MKMMMMIVMVMMVMSMVMTSHTLTAFYHLTPSSLQNPSQFFTTTPFRFNYGTKRFLFVCK